MSAPAPLPTDYTLEEVAEALGMSSRWVRDRIRLDGAVHQRYGHKIRFTPAQVDALRAAHAQAPVEQSVTTGRKKRAS
jgi:predicted DNA-binding protein YlxM (UPF0122 family)